MSAADINLLPEYAREHELATISVKNAKDEYENKVVPADRLEDAEVVTSKATVQFPYGATLTRHRPILDIDMPVTVIPSSTPGHGHLYIDKLLTWGQYKRLLDVLAEVGIIEHGYLNASIERGFTAVRLPWIKKKEIEEL
jgi:hypothetical protein